MNWDTLWTVLGVICFAGGTFLTLIAAIGLLRFPDLLARLHAASKPQVLGLGLMLAGFAFTMREPGLAWTCVLIFLFQLITAPVSAHLAGRSGYRTGQVVSKNLYVDEYRRDLARSLRQARADQGRARRKGTKGKRPH